MTPPHDVCIRGAGIVGRTLALLLAQERLRVALVAAPAPPADVSDVRAYALNAASRRMLQSLRSWPEGEAVTPVASMQVQGDDGGEVRFDAEEFDVDALAWIVDVQALQVRLEQAAGFQPLVETFTEAPPAALTVVCEGKASGTRAGLETEFAVMPYGQAAIAARLRCDIAHGGVARQWFSNGEILAFLPLGGAAGNSIAIVWSVSAARAVELQALDAAAFAAEVNAASHLALGPAVLTSALGRWPLQKAGAVHWVGKGGEGAWALAGDAAHTVHPLAGQGLNLGLADAAALTAVLREREAWRTVADEKLLRRYERARKADVAAMTAATDSLQLLFGRGEAPLKALRNWGMNGFDSSGPLKAWVARQAMGLVGR